MLSRRNAEDHRAILQLDTIRATMSGQEHGIDRGRTATDTGWCAAHSLRHADLSTTLRVYTHVMRHSRDGVAERLDEALWGDGSRNAGCKRAASGPETVSSAIEAGTVSALTSGK